MSFKCSTHLFGSISGYSTLAKSSDISEEENVALSGLGFGQTTCEDFISSLDSDPSAYGRQLPSGRYAITRCFAGEHDDVGRTTLLLATVIVERHDWIAHVKGNLKSFLKDKQVWNLETFQSGRRTQSKSYGGTIQPTLDDYYLADYLIKISVENQNPVVVLQGDRDSSDAILHLAGVLSPEDSLEFRWGIRMLSTTVPVDIMTFEGVPSEIGRRRIVHCSIQHSFFSEYVSFFADQRDTYPTLPPLAVLAAKPNDDEPIKARKSNVIIALVGFCIAVVIVIGVVVFSLSKSEPPDKREIAQNTDENPVAVFHDACPDDPDKTVPGECGCGVADVDSDGDGVLDCNDGCPDDPKKQAPGECGCGVENIDSDGDGVMDCYDGCPNDPDKAESGVCGCGFEDIDSDGDGMMDCNDGCPKDPNKIEPGDCGCFAEEIDSDGDGSLDCIDGCSNDPNKIEPGECGCGVADVDSDGDGVLDCNDGCPDDSNKTEPGECGCGVKDIDSDGDGVLDCNDGCLDDPNKIEPGDCGCGVDDIDYDVDGISDCIDDDDDGDDIIDADDLEPLHKFASGNDFIQECYELFIEIQTTEVPEFDMILSEFKNAIRDYEKTTRSDNGSSKAYKILRVTNKRYIEEYLKKYLKTSESFLKKLRKIKKTEIKNAKRQELEQIIKMYSHLCNSYEAQNGIREYYIELNRASDSDIEALKNLIVGYGTGNGKSDGWKRQFLKLKEYGMILQDDFNEGDRVIVGETELLRYLYERIKWLQQIVEQK